MPCNFSNNVFLDALQQLRSNVNENLTSLQDRINLENKRHREIVFDKWSKWNKLIQDKQGISSLLKISSDLAIEDEFLYDTAVFIIEYFHGKAILSNYDVDQIREKFLRNISRDEAEQMRSLVYQLTESIIIDCDEEIKNSPKPKLFGSSIRVFFDLSKRVISDNENFKDFSEGQLNFLNAKFKMQSDVDIEQSTQKVNFNEQWLKDNLAGTHDPETMTKMVIDFVLTNESESLQPLLFDLLGTEMLELICQIISNRYELIDNIIKERKRFKLMSQLEKAKEVIGVPSHVTVKSADEVKLLKQLKKANRKNMKDERKENIDNINFHEINPAEFRLK
ncbi:hypothetical protein GJ496_011248, partial [Pomphorhynchus laevis]